MDATLEKSSGRARLSSARRSGDVATGTLDKSSKSVQTAQIFACSSSSSSLVLEFRSDKGDDDEEEGRRTRTIWLGLRRAGTDAPYLPAIG